MNQQAPVIKVSSPIPASPKSSNQLAESPLPSLPFIKSESQRLHNRSKFKLKDLLITHKDDIKEFQQDMTAQQKAQMNRYKRNEKLFNSLQETLSTRKMTFAKFAFKLSESEEDHYLRPILKGLYDKEKPGTMLVSELWTKDAQRNFLQCSNLNQPKRVLKRFAHWEWDQNFRTQTIKSVAEKLHVDIFTRKSEQQTKLKLQSLKGGDRLKKEIKRKWGGDDGSDSQMASSTRCIIYKPISSSPILQKSQQLDTSTSKVDRSKRLSVPSLSFREIYKSDQMNQMRDIINGLTDLKEECSRDHQSLRVIQTKIQTQIQKQEKKKQIKGQNPFVFDNLEA